MVLTAGRCTRIAVASVTLAGTIESFRELAYFCFLDTARVACNCCPHGASVVLILVCLTGLARRRMRASIASFASFGDDDEHFRVQNNKSIPYQARCGRKWPSMFRDSRSPMWRCQTQRPDETAGLLSLHRYVFFILCLSFPHFSPRQHRLRRDMSSVI